MSDYFTNHSGPRLTLVATRLPPGKVFYATPGQHDDPDRLREFARTCGDRPKDFVVVRATSVGLEWHYDGEKATWGDSYRKGRWVCLMDASAAVAHPREPAGTLGDGA